MRIFVQIFISIFLTFSISYSYSIQITNPYIIDSEIEVDDREASYVAMVASFCITALYGLLLNKCSEKAIEKGLDKAKKEIIAQIQAFHGYGCNRYINLSVQSKDPWCYSGPRGSHECIIDDTHYGYKDSRRIPVKMCYYLEKDTSDENKYRIADMYKIFEQQGCSNQLVTTTYHWANIFDNKCRCYGVEYQCGNMYVEIKKNF